MKIRHPMILRHPVVDGEQTPLAEEPHFIADSPVGSLSLLSLVPSSRFHQFDFFLESINFLFCFSLQMYLFKCTGATRLH